MTTVPICTIAGREYVVVQPPFRADHRLYLAAELAAAGLDRVGETIAAATDHSAGVRDVFVIAARSGRLPHLVAGFIVERHQRWSRRDALARAEQFAALTDQADVAAFDLAVTVSLLALVQSPSADTNLGALATALDDILPAPIGAPMLH